MNEFTVWDKKRKEWLHSPDFPINLFGEVIIMGEILSRKDGTHVKIEDLNDIQAFNYIGRTDINNKKIYADCSIVEFDYKGKRLQGVFIYSKMRLSYVIEDIYNDMGEMVYDGSQTNFKIIDTIQENKLGLIK